MKVNVGSIDRAIRILMGSILIAAALFGFIGVWGWLGIIPLTTGIFRICPAYLLFGLNTCKSKQ